jgi:hypothetical protein
MRVDEKLTERREEASFNGTEGTQENGDDLGFTACEPLTSFFGRSSSMLDAEEARGSNPLAPTSKGPGYRAFSLDQSRRSAAKGPRS